LPAILRFRNLRVVIYTEDHSPAHVHVIGPDGRAVFLLNCWRGPISILKRYNLNQSEETAIANFLNIHVELLCNAWPGEDSAATAGKRIGWPPTR
jgi:hypothetical protein